MKEERMEDKGRKMKEGEGRKKDEGEKEWHD
jgi:hypothetical protein